MDDIVTRLRDTAEHHADLWLEAIVTEAADEIERLRAEVARLGSFLHPIGMIIQGEAVRDE